LDILSLKWTKGSNFIRDWGFSLWNNKYVEESCSRLGSPSERGEFLVFIRYNGDVNPASNIKQMQEVYSELCIYNKYLDSLKNLPVKGALYKVILPFETLY